MVHALVTDLDGPSSSAYGTYRNFVQMCCGKQCNHWLNQFDFKLVQGYLVHQEPEISKRSVSVSYLGGPIKKLSENARCPFLAFVGNSRETPALFRTA